MARQSTTPVPFEKSVRRDDGVCMTSGRAGKVVPVTYFPLLRGDSASGKVAVDCLLAEMPRPVLNGVVANFQAWFVPKLADPRFSGRDEFMHSYQGTPIKALASADRSSPPFFYARNYLLDAQTEVLRSLGVHLRPSTPKTSVPVITDLIDAYNLIYNFRLASFSSRLMRRPYSFEDKAKAVKLAPAFWPSGRFTGVVPDYENALVVGKLDLDVQAGRLPVSGIGLINAGGAGSAREAASPAGAIWSDAPYTGSRVARSGNFSLFETVSGTPRVFAEMAGQVVGTSLADVDKARVTQAMAKLRTAYAGADTTGFDPDDTIIAELMQGFRVPDEAFHRPILLDSAVGPVVFAERFATDGNNLDASVSQGRASAVLSLNVPANDYGGVVMVTVEIVPERIEERQLDYWLHNTTVAGLPDALRDIQRTEPVDMVTNDRLDVKHSVPGGLYGYEPMNDVWNRSFTRLGGSFYQPDPSNPFSEQRSALWLSSIVDPTYTADHFVVPENLSHAVFSDTLADAFECVSRHSVSIVGLTQIGDVLVENNGDFADVEGEQG